MATRHHFIFISRTNTKKRFQVRQVIRESQLSSNPESICLLDYVRRFATEEALRETEKKDDSSDSELSDFSDDETKDMEL